MLGKGIFERKKGDKVSSFAALATAVGAQVGTGNIVGAAAAILIGGPGAVFWMWVSAFFGMATVYAEAVAAQKTRIITDESDYVGGPVFYIKKAFRNKTGRLLAFIFSFFAVLTLGFSGAMVQSNAISGTLKESYGISAIVSGLILASLCLAAFSGGLGRIVKISEKLVVIMTVVFFSVCGYVIVLNIGSIPSTINLIIKSAFLPNSVIGGSIGSALKITVGQGVKKGIFSNEAGMGTTPHIHASADAESPHAQGLFAMMGVFIDTFVILTVTSLVMLTSLYGPDGCQKATMTLDMNNMMLFSLREGFTETAATIIMSISIVLFGFSSIISWNYFGRVNAEYLWGKSSLKLYIIFSAIFIFMGSVFEATFVWQITDAMNVFLIMPNIIALYKLRNTTVFNGK